MDLEHEERLSKVEERSKSNSRRIEDLEKRQDNLDQIVRSVDTLSVKYGHMESDVKEIKADVKTLADKPGKKWEFVVEKALYILVAAIVGFLLARFGLPVP